MLAMNFVDVHTYGFETKVLPLAREHGLGIACMKVFGGMQGGFEVADGPNTGPMVPHRAKELAVRYALGLERSPPWSSARTPWSSCAKTRVWCAHISR